MKKASKTGGKVLTTLESISCFTLSDRITALEKRVADLEQRPIYMPYMPCPPYPYPQFPYSQTSLNSICKYCGGEIGGTHGL